MLEFWSRPRAKNPRTCSDWRTMRIAILIALAFGIGVARADEFDCDSAHMKEQYESLKRITGSSEPYEKWCVREGSVYRTRAESQRRSKIADTVSATELCSWKDPYYLALRWERRTREANVDNAPEPLRSVLETERFLREAGAESLSWVIQAWGARKTVVASLSRVGEPELARLASRGFALSPDGHRDEQNANDRAFRKAAANQRFLNYFMQNCPKLVAEVDRRVSR
jgi:hypothetical protein